MPKHICNQCGRKAKLVCRYCGSRWCKDCHKARGKWNYLGPGRCGNCGKKGVVYIK